ncbi:MAG: hypothetical protein JRH06_14795 [Deltaproteobacteria bacterium]|nr:hypothetical protein [Deltaproteobacteria bacterium]MBW2138804.1 hypothetical protein [Deltaproteobacteria bacterium]
MRKDEGPFAGSGRIRTTSERRATPSTDTPYDRNVLDGGKENREREHEQEKTNIRSLSPKAGQW